MTIIILATSYIMSNEVLAQTVEKVELEKIYGLLNTSQTKKIISEWTKRSSTIGKKVEINTVNGRIKGEAVKIDEDGGLLIKNKGKINKVIAGDIIHLSK